MGFNLTGAIRSDKQNKQKGGAIRLKAPQQMGYRLIADFLGVRTPNTVS